MTDRLLLGLRAIARRRLSILAVAVVACGCAAPAADISQGASATAAASASASDGASSEPPTPSPTPSSTASDAASASPSITTAFEFLNILQVGVDGLAVRSAPSVISPLAKVYRWNGQTHLAIGDARLAAGDYVSVELGPLQIGDTVWYLVWPAEDARLHYSPSQSWDANGDFETNGGNDPAWVAASVAEDQYLTLFRTTDPSEYANWPAGGPMTVMVSGTGDYMSEPQVQHDMYDFDWAAAVPDQAVPCSFSVTLVPEDGAEPVLVIETAVADSEQGPTQGPAGVVDTPWDGSAGHPGDALFRVSVRSGCAWAFKLEPLPHD
jgi:hypothetical protein